MLLGLKASNSFLILRVFEKKMPHLGFFVLPPSLWGLFQWVSVWVQNLHVYRECSGQCVGLGVPMGNIGLWLCYVPGEFGMEKASNVVAVCVLNRHITMEVCWSGLNCEPPKCVGILTLVLPNVFLFGHRVFIGVSNSNEVMKVKLNPYQKGRFGHNARPPRGKMMWWHREKMAMGLEWPTSKPKIRIAFEHQELEERKKELP